MIVLDDFVKAIHDAVLAANQSLSQNTLSVLDEYFEDSGKTAAVQDSLDAALKATQDVLNNPRPGRDTYLNLKKTLEDAGRSLQGDTGPEASASKASNPQSYTPKTVTLQYASQSDDGPVIQEVKVPLITLVPMPSTQIAQARFKTKLEVQEQDGKLMISFPTKSQVASPDASFYFTEFEVVLEPKKEAAGLAQVVEGYEKLLRAQIPH